MRKLPLNREQAEALRSTLEIDFLDPAGEFRGRILAMLDLAIEAAFPTEETVCAMLRAFDIQVNPATRENARAALSALVQGEKKR